MAETTSGGLISAECCATTGQREGGEGGGHQRKRARGEEDGDALLVPEDIGKAAALALLEEINRWDVRGWRSVDNRQFAIGSRCRGVARCHQQGDAVIGAVKIGR